MYLHEHGETFPAPALEGVKRLARAVKASDVRDWALKSGLAGEDDKPGTVRERWRRANAELIAAGKIGQHGDLVWPVL